MESWNFGIPNLFMIDGEDIRTYDAIRKQYEQFLSDSEIKIRTIYKYYNFHKGKEDIYEIMDKCIFRDFFIEHAENMTIVGKGISKYSCVTQNACFKFRYNIFEQNQIYQEVLLFQKYEYLDCFPRIFDYDEINYMSLICEKAICNLDNDLSEMMFRLNTCSLLNILKLVVCSCVRNNTGVLHNIQNEIKGGLSQNNELDFIHSLIYSPEYKYEILRKIICVCFKENSFLDGELLSNWMVFSRRISNMECNFITITDMGLKPKLLIQ